jgi:hypothetical protein
MKSNISIELNDQQRDHLSNIYHNKKSSKLLTRKELNDLVTLMINDLLDQDVGNFKQVTTNIAEEGFTYRFNDVRVTAEEYEAGIHVWLEKRKKNNA